MNQSLILRPVVEGGEHIKEEGRDKEKYLSNSPPHNQKKNMRGNKEINRKREKES